MASAANKPYLVQIDPANFTAGGPLAGQVSSDGGPGSPYESSLPAAYNNTNNVDHGRAVAGQGVLSRPIDLQVASQPTGEEGDAPAVYTGGDNNSNLTADFGFAHLMRIGNVVFNDPNNNGVYDGGETPIPGVKLNLYYDTNGNGVYDPGTDQLVPGVAQQTTDGGGKYLFDNLLPGKYFVVIDPSNFLAGGPLQNKAPSATVSTANNPQPGRDGSRGWGRQPVDHPD